MRAMRLTRPAPSAHRPARPFELSFSKAGDGDALRPVTPSAAEVGAVPFKVAEVDEFNGCANPAAYCGRFVWMRDVFVALTHLLGGLLMLIAACYLLAEATMLKTARFHPDGVYAHGHTGWMCVYAGAVLYAISDLFAIVLSVAGFFNAEVRVWWPEGEAKDLVRQSLHLLCNLSVAVLAMDLANWMRPDYSMVSTDTPPDVAASLRTVQWQLFYGVRRFATSRAAHTSFAGDHVGTFDGEVLGLAVVYGVRVVYILVAWFLTHEHPFALWPLVCNRNALRALGGREEAPSVGTRMGPNYVRMPCGTCGGALSRYANVHLGALRNYVHLASILYFVGFVTIVDYRQRSGAGAGEGFVPWAGSVADSSYVRGLPAGADPRLCMYEERDASAVVGRGEEESPARRPSLWTVQSGDLFREYEYVEDTCTLSSANSMNQLGAPGALSGARDPANYPDNLPSLGPIKIPAASWAPVPMPALVPTTWEEQYRIYNQTDCGSRLQGLEAGLVGDESLVRCRMDALRHLAVPMSAARDGGIARKLMAYPSIDTNGPLGHANYLCEFHPAKRVLGKHAGALARYVGLRMNQLPCFDYEEYWTPEALVAAEYANAPPSDVRSNRVTPALAVGSNKQGWPAPPLKEPLARMPARRCCPSPGQSADSFATLGDHNDLGQTMFVASILWVVAATLQLLSSLAFAAALVLYGISATVSDVPRNEAVVELNPF